MDYKTFRVMFNNDGEMRYHDVEAMGVRAYRNNSGELTDIQFTQSKKLVILAPADVAAIVEL